MSERRRYIRVTPEPERPIRVDINGENFLDILYVSDISEGGIGFQVEHQFSGCAIERPVHFILDLPPPVSALISAEGSIRHVMDRAFGIEFGTLSREARHHIHDYIHYRLCRQSLLVRVAHSLHVPDALIHRM